MMSFTGKIIIPSNWGIFVEWPFNDDWPVWFVSTEVTYFDFNIYDNFDIKISFRLEANVDANVDSMTVIFWDIFLTWFVFMKYYFLASDNNFKMKNADRFWMCLRIVKRFFCFGFDRYYCWLIYRLMYSYKTCVRKRIADAFVPNICLRNPKVRIHQRKVNIWKYNW